MEGVAKWMEKLGVLDSDAAQACRSIACLKDELKNGIILAKIASKLDPENVARDSFVGCVGASNATATRQVAERVALFIETHDRLVSISLLGPFKSAMFTVNDVKDGTNTEQVVAAMHNVAGELEWKGSLRAFAMPCSETFCDNVIPGDKTEMTHAKNVRHYSNSLSGRYTGYPIYLYEWT